MNEFFTETDLIRLEEGRKMYEAYRGFNFDTQKEYYLLKKYFDNDENKKQALNFGFNFVKTIIDNSTRFFIGPDTTFTPNYEEYQGQIDGIVKRSNLKQEMRHMGNNLQIFGYTSARVMRKEDGKAKLKLIDYVSHYPRYDISGELASFVVGVWIEDDNGGLQKGVKERYFYTQEYKKATAGVQVEHKIYSVHDQTSLYMSQVKFSSVEALGGAFDQYDDNPIQVITEIDDLPIAIMQDLGFAYNERPISVVSQFYQLVQEIHETLLRIKIEFVKHAFPVLVIPSNAIEGTNHRFKTAGAFDPDKWRVIVTSEGDAELPQYITNSNPVIEQQFQQIEKLIDLAAAIAVVPEKFFGKEQTSGDQKVRAKELEMAPFIRKVEDYMGTIREGIEKLLIDGLKMEGAAVPEDMKIDIEFRSGLPKDMLEEAQIYSIAVNGGFMTKKRAMMEFNNMSSEEADEELAEIQPVENQIPFGQTNDDN